MKILGPGLPGPKFAHPLMMKLFKRGTVKSAHGHGIGRHSEEEVKKIGLADLKVSLVHFLCRARLKGGSQVLLCKLLLPGLACSIRAIWSPHEKLVL